MHLNKNRYDLIANYFDDDFIISGVFSSKISAGSSFSNENAMITTFVYKCKLNISMFLTAGQTN